MKLHKLLHACKKTCVRAALSLWRYASASAYNAKMLLLFALYVAVLVLSLPESIAALRAPASPASAINALESSPESILNPTMDSAALDSAQAPKSWLAYGYLVFVPFVKLITHFAENPIGIMVLFLAFVLSERFAILRHYALLFLLYLACAYPSMQLGGEIFPAQQFLGTMLEPLSLLKSSDYAMLFAYYSRGIVWVFLGFAVFDMVFFLLHSLRASPQAPLTRQARNQIYENLGFALGLYMLVFGIYSYDRGALVFY